MMLGHIEREYLKRLERTGFDEPSVQSWLTSQCCQCNSDQPSERDHVLVADGKVAIGCKGYLHVDPYVLGMDFPNWQTDPPRNGVYIGDVK